MYREPEIFEIDMAWEWIGEHRPEVDSKNDPKFLDALEDIMRLNDESDPPSL